MCYTFNLGSWYFHVALTTVRHLLSVCDHNLTRPTENEWSIRNVPRVDCLIYDHLLGRRPTSSKTGASGSLSTPRNVSPPPEDDSTPEIYFFSDIIQFLWNIFLERAGLAEAPRFLRPHRWPAAAVYFNYVNTTVPKNVWSWVSW